MMGMYEVMEQRLINARRDLLKLVDKIENAKPWETTHEGRAGWVAELGRIITEELTRS